MENSTSLTRVENATNQQNLFSSDMMPVFKVMFTIILVVIMFGMGCAVEFKKLLKHLKRPVGLTIGLFCQIVLMPILTYILITVSGMSTIQAIAFVLVGCAPGGSNSNVITFLIKGDMSLSVAMTTSSNLLCLGTLPMWIWVFTSIAHIDNSFRIPYDSLVITLASIVVPIALGMTFRYKSPRHSKTVPKVCAGIGIFILIISVVSMVIVTKMPFVFTPQSILPVCMLPVFGMAMAYLIAWIPFLKLSDGARKAIWLETGIQNGGIANSILILTFGDRVDLLGPAITVPLLYNVATTVYILIIVGVYRIWLCITARGEIAIAGTPPENETAKEVSPLNVPSGDSAL